MADTPTTLVVHPGIAMVVPSRINVANMATLAASAISALHRMMSRTNTVSMKTATALKPWMMSEDQLIEDFPT